MMAILISFILFNFILPAQAETALWKVSKEGKYLYLAGTIHILQKSDYPLPKEYINVYKQSDVLVFETDIEKMHDSEVAIKLLEAMVYDNGTTIDTILKKETMDALNIYLN